MLVITVYFTHFACVPISNSVSSLVVIDVTALLAVTLEGDCTQIS